MFQGNEMKLKIRMLQVVFPICLLVLLGGCGEPGVRSPNERDSSHNVSVSLDSSTLRKGDTLKKRVRDICQTMQSMTNSEVRVKTLHETANAVASIDFAKFSLREKEGMSQNFFRVYEQLSYHLIENGVSEQIVGDFIISGFRKYREMCFSFGDEKDMSDGKGREAMERRRMARGMRLAWLNDAGFFEQHSIRTIFYNHKDAGRRFAERWHREFGYHDERIKKYSYSLP